MAILIWQNFTSQNADLFTYLALGCVILQILEPCQSSLAYQPPNPWTMGILGLLAEIYALPNLKMNLKFDIEVFQFLSGQLYFKA
jgi:hypothetical protein